MSISSWRIFLTILSFSEIGSKNNCEAYDFKRIAASRNLLQSLCSASEANEDSDEEQEETTTKKMKFMDEEKGGQWRKFYFAFCNIDFLNSLIWPFSYLLPDFHLSHYIPTPPVSLRSNLNLISNQCCYKKVL